VEKRSEPPFCGNCRHFHAHAQMLGMGQCWCGPPQMIPTMANGQPGMMPVRPVAGVRERPCGQWAAAAPDLKLPPSAIEAGLKSITK